MAKPFYETNLFVVQPEKESSKKSNYWNILTAGGVRLAVMHHTPDSLPVKLCRKLGITATFGTKIMVEDTDGKPMLGFAKPFTFGMFKTEVRDTEGLLGRIEEEKVGLEGRSYVMYDAKGTPRGSLIGDWRSYSLQMRAAKGDVLGKISRKSDELNKVIFPEKSSFYVVHLYIDQNDKRWRKLLLSTCAAIGLLLR